MNVSLKSGNEKYKSPLTYAVKHKDKDIRLASRSGGVFSALSDKVLNIGGVVYGCVMENNIKAIHIRAENKEQRNRMRGSKYIQSEMRDVFSAVKSDLEKGIIVLFSGTSCQVAGLYGFLTKDYPNLICADIVCHGVPSPRVWQDYIVWQEEKNNSKIVNIDFRNKSDYGWSAHVESLYFENKVRIDSNIFTTLFYGHSILRPCCYKCPYKRVIHPGNITIADYWGIDVAAPGFSDDMGVSLVLINDNKGLQLFESIKEGIDFRETYIEESMQEPLKRPCDRPYKRNRFWKDYQKRSFSKIVSKYGKINLGQKCIGMIKHVLKTI